MSIVFVFSVSETTVDINKSINRTRLKLRQLQIHAYNTEVATQQKLSILNPNKNQYKGVKFLEHDIMHLDHVIA